MSWFKIHQLFQAAFTLRYKNMQHVCYSTSLVCIIFPPMHFTASWSVIKVLFIYFFACIYCKHAIDTLKNSKKYKKKLPERYILTSSTAPLCMCWLYMDRQWSQCWRREHRQRRIKSCMKGGKILVEEAPL